LSHAITQNFTILPHSVFGVVVDACPEPGRRDEAEFFFKKPALALFAGEITLNTNIFP